MEARLTAWKFLRPGAVGAFSGFAWPLPGDGGPGPWVEAAPALCATGIHACSLADLPYWLDVELWEIELGGPIDQGAKKLVAGRGRLVRRVDGWNDGTMGDFAAACADRLRTRAERDPALESYLADVAGPRVRPATAAFVAARVAELADGAVAYAAEREWQALWLAQRLGLDGAPAN